MGGEFSYPKMGSQIIGFDQPDLHFFFASTGHVSAHVHTSGFLETRLNFLLSMP